LRGASLDAVARRVGVCSSVQAALHTSPTDNPAILPPGPLLQRLLAYCAASVSPSAMKCAMSVRRSGWRDAIALRPCVLWSGRSHRAHCWQSPLKTWWKANSGDGLV